MKAKDLVLKVVNQLDKDEYELIEVAPTMKYEEIVGMVLEDAEILRPTGIKDIEGKVIYENYIIEVEEMIGDKRKYNCIVKYNDSKARFEAREIRTDIKYIHQMDILNSLCKLKVIGNIYQNEELLK